MKFFYKYFFVIIILITIGGCKKHNYLCWNNCLANKLGDYSEITGIWLDGVDYTEKYLSNDTVPKHFFYSSNKQKNKKFSSNAASNNDYIQIYTIKTNIRDTISEIGIIRECSIENFGTRILFKKLKYPTKYPNTEYFITYLGGNVTYDFDIHKPTYHPYLSAVFSFAPDYYELYEIKHRYIVLKYSVNNTEVKIKISRK